MNIFISISHLLHPLLWIGSSGLLFASADLLFRHWYHISSSLFFFLGMVVASLAMFCLAMSFPHQNVAVAIIVSILCNIIFYLIGAYLIYGDMITIRESIGLLIAFAAIFILEGIK